MFHLLINYLGNYNQCIAMGLRIMYLNVKIKIIFVWMNNELYILIFLTFYYAKRQQEFTTS